MPDEKLDIEDIMSFAMMWNWYNTSNSSAISDLISFGNPVHLEFDHSGITMEFPQNAVAGQVEIMGINGELNYDVKKNNEYFSQDYFNEETQYFTYLSQRNNKGTMEIPFKIKGKNIDLQMKFKFVDQNGNIISQATQSINIENVPEEFALHQNYPNPFNPVTTINYDLPLQSYVRIVIYDLLGRQIKELINQNIDAGYHSILWNTKNDLDNSVSPGIYFYQIQTKDFVKTRKMVLLK